MKHPAASKVPTAPLVMTVTQAAAALNIGRTALYQLFGRGELPFVRIGGRTMVPVAALHEFVAKPATSLRERDWLRTPKSSKGSKQSRGDAAA